MQGTLLTYLIIALALAFIVAPIIAILPSKRQKEQMLLRRKAAGVGLRVDITRIDDPVPKQEKYLSNLGKPLAPNLTISAYRRSRARAEARHPKGAVGWAIEKRALPGHDDLPGTWAWLPMRPPLISDEYARFLAEALRDLPEDAVRVDEAGGVISVYWHERTGELGLAAVLDFLEGCVAKPSGIQSDDSDDVDDLS